MVLSGTRCDVGNLASTAGAMAYATSPLAAMSKGLNAFNMAVSGDWYGVGQMTGEHIVNVAVVLVTMWVGGEIAGYFKGPAKALPTEAGEGAARWTERSSIPGLALSSNWSVSFLCDSANCAFWPTLHSARQGRLPSEDERRWAALVPQQARSSRLLIALRPPRNREGWLVVGGTVNDAQGNAAETAELYDSATGLFVDTGNLWPTCRPPRFSSRMGESSSQSLGRPLSSTHHDSRSWRRPWFCDPRLTGESAWA
jgi:hypothetical protein